jgi:hypothetical protein
VIWKGLVLDTFLIYFFNFAQGLSAHGGMKLFERVLRIWLNEVVGFLVEWESVIVEMFGFGLKKRGFVDFGIDGELNGRREVDEIDIEVDGLSGRIGHGRL